MSSSRKSRTTPFGFARLLSTSLLTLQCGTTKEGHFEGAFFSYAMTRASGLPEFQDND